MKKIKKILGRLQRSLSRNELRDYLENKKETSNVKEFDTSSNFLNYREDLKGKKIKVLLVSPPITIPKYMQKRCIPPLGISYVAASLRKHNIDVEIIDCCVEGWEIERESNDGSLITYGLPPKEMLSKVCIEKFDVVGVSVLFSTDLPNLYETTRAIKGVAPNAIVVAGGLHPTIYPEEIFDLDIAANKSKTVDFIIRGEGEVRFVNFLNNLQRGKLNIKQDGLCGIYKNKRFLNHQIETIQDLDSIPFPAFDMLPIEKYFKINIPFSPVPQGKRVLPFLTTRGCPIGCSFCANTNVWKKHRKRSVGNIIEEIQYLKNNYQIDEIQFADDNLTFDKKHSYEKFKEIEKENIIWCTPNGTMINKLNEDLIEQMFKSGLYQLTLSLDSANTRTLKELHHKPVNLNSIPGMIKKCRELGVFTHGTLVVGMPGETIEEIRDGFEYVKKNLHFTSISTFIAAAIPGSELYHQMIDAGKVSKESARQIDTTKAKINLSDIDLKVLENEVDKFQSEYLEISKKRDPKEYQRKYAKLINTGRWDENQIGGKLT